MRFSTYHLAEGSHNQPNQKPNAHVGNKQRTWPKQCVSEDLDLFLIV
jgi:hypothetical protein